MTDQRSRLRTVWIVSLVVLLLLSPVAGIGAFASVVAADQGEISFDSSTYSPGDTVTVTVEDGDLSTSEEYVINIQSESESKETILNQDVPDGTKLVTTNYPVSDANGDNKITPDDVVYDNNGDSSGRISSVSRNENGTLEIQLTSQSDSDDTIGYNLGETIEIKHTEGDKFSGTISVDESDKNGVLYVEDNDDINSTYSDESAGEKRISNATIEKKDETSNDDTGPLTHGSVTEFSIGSLAGTTLTHTESVIEVPFSEDVSKAGGKAGGLTLADNITVTVDGSDVTDRYTLDADGSADGQVVLSSDTALNSRATATVTIDAVNDSADTETIRPGEVDVAVTAATLAEGDDASTFENATVAFVATDGSADHDQAFEVENETGALRLASSTGPGSQAFVFDTGSRNWSGEHTVETFLDGGSVDQRTDLSVRSLGLNATVTDRNVTTADAIEGTVSANAAGRDVEIRLRDTDEDAVVDRVNRTLGGNGNEQYSFDDDSLTDAGRGNYTVNVTDVETGRTASGGRIHVVDASERTVGLRSSVVEEHAGDVAVFRVDLAYTDTATLTVGGPAVGIRANATVADRDGDGTVWVRFNTAAVVNASTLPADGGDVFAVGSEAESDGADEVIAADVDDENAPSEPLDPGEYELSVRAGTDTSTPSEGVGTLVLATAEPKRLLTRTAPAGATYDDAADVSAAIEAGHLTRTAAVADGDRVVHQLVLPGLAGEFARQSGNATETFFALAASAESGTDALYDLNVTRSDVPNADAEPLGVNASTARVVADPGNDTYFLVYSTADPALPVAAGDELTASFAARENGTYADLADDERHLSAEYALLEGTITPASEPVTVVAAANQSISGSTTVAPGSEVRLRVRSTNGTEPAFLKTTHATVNPNGTWSAPVDFEDQRVGDAFTVTSDVRVIDPGAQLDLRGEVRPVETTSAATRAATATPSGGGGGGGSAPAAGDPAAAEESTSTPEPTVTSTRDSDDTVIDSTRQFVGGVIGTFVDESAGESLRDRLFEFDVFVAVGAILAVGLFVSRSG